MSVTARLRPANRGDRASMEAFHGEQNERDGTSYPLPDLFGGGTVPRVPVVLVVEDEDGRVLGSLYVDTAPELCFAGCDPRATAVARRDIEALAWALRQYGFNHMRCLVPEVQVEAIRKPLERAGFRERADLRVFTRTLAQKNEGKDDE